MFACGNYPAFPNYLESVRKEFVANLRRLCDHPCIIMYAGNNEDYQVQESAGLKYDYSAKDPQSWLKTDFPARYIYEKVSHHIHYKTFTSRLKLTNLLIYSYSPRSSRWKLLI